ESVNPYLMATRQQQDSTFQFFEKGAILCRFQISKRDRMFPQRVRRRESQFHMSVTDFNVVTH
ncbi:MAG: hypothetical protein WA952_15205, partial [Lewinella sp.]